MNFHKYGGGGGNRTHVRNGCRAKDYVCISFIVYSASTLEKPQNKPTPNPIDLGFGLRVEALGLFRMMTFDGKPTDRLTGTAT